MPADSDREAPSRPTRDGELKQPGARQSRVRRYWGWIIGALAAFGILGAIGSRVVDWGTTAAGEKINPEKPLLIGVREDPRGGGDGFSLAARSSAGLDAKLGAVKGCDPLMVAAKAAGAANVRKVTERLILEGGTRHDISIVDMRAKVLKREATYSGASIGCQSAGAVGGIGILFDLDKEDPVALKLTDGDSLTTAGPYFDHGDIINLAKGETLGFEVVGISTRSYVEWEIEADVIIDGEERTITIRNHGRPFRVTGALDSNSRYERYYEYQWYETPARMYMANEPSTP